LVQDHSVLTQEQAPVEDQARGEEKKSYVVFKARGASITGYVIDEQRRRRQKKH
jgi:hypothetical protein